MKGTWRYGKAGRPLRFGGDVYGAIVIVFVQAPSPADVLRRYVCLSNLRKALYGCQESKLIWFRTLSEFLRGHGFKANPYDQG